MEELFKQIEGYPNYEIGEQGSIRNITTGNFLKPQRERTGYYHVRLYYEDPAYPHTQYKQEKIHRLVAKHWVPNPKPDEFDEVCYKNNNKDDFRAQNLQWCGRIEVIQKVHKASKINPQTGKRYRYSKPVLYVRKDGSQILFDSRIICAHTLGIDVNHVNSLTKNGKYSYKIKGWLRSAHEEGEKLSWEEMKQKIEELEQTLKNLQNAFTED